MTLAIFIDHVGETTVFCYDCGEEFKRDAMGQFSNYGHQCANALTRLLRDMQAAALYKRCG